MKYCHSSLVLPVPFWLSYSGCPVLAVLCCLFNSACVFCLSSSICPLLPVLFCLSSSACPFVAVLFFLSCTGSPILAVYRCTCRSTKLRTRKSRSTKNQGVRKKSAKNRGARERESPASKCAKFKAQKKERESASVNSSARERESSRANT
jgi:hypothetical protein